MFENPRLVTLFRNDSTCAAVAFSDQSAHLLPYADVGELIRTGLPLDEKVSNATRSGERVTFSLNELAPLITTPGKIICLGLNYSEHVAEMGHDAGTYPTLFAKFGDTLTGPFADIDLPVISNATDYEVELAIVIGAKARNVSPGDAHRTIAGFCVANDVSMRDYQRRSSQFLQGKIFEATTPLGPALVPPAEVGFGSDLVIESWVNGEMRQSSSTSNLIFGIDEIICYISEIVSLMPGDVILTGTPSGVGAGMRPPIFLTQGDLVACSIEGVGNISNLFI